MTGQTEKKEYAKEGIVGSFDKIAMTKAQQ